MKVKRDTFWNDYDLHGKLCQEESEWIKQKQNFIDDISKAWKVTVMIGHHDILKYL